MYNKILNLLMVTKIHNVFYTTLSLPIMFPLPGVLSPISD